MTQINISTLSKGPFNNYVALPRGMGVVEFATPYIIMLYIVL